MINLNQKAKINALYSNQKITRDSNGYLHLQMEKYIFKIYINLNLFFKCKFKDNASKITYNEIIKNLQSSNVNIIIVGLGLDQTV